MENHIFGEPVPVVYYPESTNSKNEEVSSDHKGDAEPSWTVDVIRKGSNVVVGTMVINNTKLPPRRNKNKKIVWKLPTTNNTGTEEDIPRFGKQDYPRLWEIYKEEKKKRRSLNKTTVTNTSSSNSIDDDNNNCNDTSGTSNDMEDKNIIVNDCIDRCTPSDVQDADDGTNIKIRVTDDYLNNYNPTTVYPNQEAAAAAAAAAQNTYMIAPPPGFELAASTTATNTGIFNINPLVNDRSTAIATTTTNTMATIRPPPGFA